MESALYKCILLLLLLLLNDVVIEHVTLDCNIANFIFIPNLINRDEILFIDLRDIGYKILHSENTSSRLVKQFPRKNDHSIWLLGQYES